MCREEHFYLLWGVALFFIPLRKTYILIVCSIIVADIARNVFYVNGWAFLDIFTNLDYFAYGAIPAMLFIMLSFGLTVAASIVAYYLIERAFLKLKSKLRQQPEWR